MPRPVHRHLVFPVLLVALVLLAVAPLAAEEATNDRGFALTLILRQAGEKAGDLFLSAKAGPVDGRPGWIVKDALTFTDTAAGTARTDAELTSGLEIVRGRYERKNAAGFLRARFTWDVEHSRYDFRHSTQEYENALASDPGSPAHGTLAGLLLMARVAGVLEERTWSFSELDPDPPGGDAYVMPAELQCHGRAPWAQDDEITDAWVFSFTRGHTSYRFALDDERRFLGLEAVGLDVTVTPPDVTHVGTPRTETRARTPTEQALEGADRIRAALPVPTAPFLFEGDLLLGPYLVGSVRLTAEPASVDGEPGYLVSELTTREVGTARVAIEWNGLLRQDLALVRGESLHRSPSRATRSVYRRVGDAMQTRHFEASEAGPSITSPVRVGATTGLFAVVRFLQAVPARNARYVLRGFDPRFVRTPKAGSGALPADLSDDMIDVQAQGEVTVAGRVHQTLAARVSARTGMAYVVHLDLETRSLIAVEGLLPSLWIVPKGTGGRRPDFFDYVEGISPGPYGALIKFGRGYHLPRRDLLAAAFDWEAMRKHELGAGNYPVGTGVETVKRDWIDEFVSRSKHRTVADCDDLLFQILMTSRETRHPDGTITIATLPAYGGHQYRLANVGDRWLIVRVD